MSRAPPGSPRCARAPRRIPSPCRSPTLGANPSRCRSPSPTEPSGNMATTDSDGVAAQYLKALTLALPKELAEVLLPPLRLRANAGRLVVVVPNPVWRDVFHELAAERLRGLLKPK